jgi:hypothetical protein
MCQWCTLCVTECVEYSLGIKVDWLRYYLLKTFAPLIGVLALFLFKGRTPEYGRFVVGRSLLRIELILLSSLLS